VGVERTATQLRDEGYDASAAKVDVSRRDDVFAAIERFLADTGRLDIMCNVAGITHDGYVVDTPETDLDRLLAVNLKGTYFGCQAAAAAMIPRGRGVIVNLASGAIDRPLAGKSLYGLTKAAITQLTKVLAHELGPHGIRVNALAPGFVLTAMTSRHFTKADGSVDERARSAAIEDARARAPLGKISEPEDVGWTVVYLASEAGRTVTGQILRPNGGAMMPW
jgi:3-oxoacyl-[acyl-carrier protein] reductase